MAVTRAWLRRTGYPPLYLALALAISLLGMVAVEHLGRAVRQPYYAQQIAAARLMRRSMAAVRDNRLADGDIIDPEMDPNRTGLIGPELGILTTSIGNLEAKRTSTNPAFAALMVKYFHEAGLVKGDVVAVGASGSFPAAIVATLAAARVLGLEPILIYSVGASTFGANTPGLSFAILLPHLRRRGLLPYSLAAVSLGGEADRGEGALFDDGKLAMLAVAKQAGAPLILEEGVAASIRRRLEIYRQSAAGRPIRCFVNIGGADPNYGATLASLRFPNGLVRGAVPSPIHPARGLIFEFAAIGTPVINLIDLRGLAVENGLPVDPIPLPPLGQGDVYYRVIRPRWLILAVMALSGSILAAGARKSRLRRDGKNGDPLQP